jgi:dUTP pyrophosphatase
MTMINGKGVSIVPGDWEQGDNKDMTIKVKYFNKDIEKLQKIEKGDWIDLRCAVPGGVTIKAGEDAIIKLGVGMILPEGYEAHIAPRSSTFKKYGILLTNSVGVIDGSYNGDNDEWLADVYAVRDTYIPFNERFLQFRIMPVMGKVGLEEVEKLNDKDRGGYGSTGHK